MAQQTKFEGPGDEIFTLKFALYVNKQILDDQRTNFGSDSWIRFTDVLLVMVLMRDDNAY